MAPAESDLGLDCDNPHTIAGLRPGETVLVVFAVDPTTFTEVALDLGSGGATVLGTLRAPGMGHRPGRRSASDRAYRHPGRWHHRSYLAAFAMARCAAANVVSSCAICS